MRLPPDQMRAVTTFITDHAPGVPYEVTVLRDGREVTVQVVNLAPPR